MALTDLEVRKASLPDGKKQIRMTDGRGLYLIINKSGKYWRYDYKFNGKRKTFSIGTYPDVPLAGKKGRDRQYIKGARDYLIDIKRLIKDGIDPVAARQQDRQHHINELKQDQIKGVTFEDVAREWYGVNEPGWTKKHAVTTMRRFELHVFPSIGGVSVVQLNKIQVAGVIKSIVSRGTIEIATRINQNVRKVLEYACDSGYIESVPMGNTKNLIPARTVKPMPSITDATRIGDVMRAIYAYSGTYTVCQALKVLPLLAVRSYEFRHAGWKEFNFDDAIWTIPASHRKLSKAQKEDPRNFHLVPLSKQAVILLKDLQGLTGRCRYVFPSSRGDSRPMSENTVNVALQTMGFKGELVGHGFRAMFSSVMNEQGFNRDAIERQLAHKERNAVRAAYNRAEYLEERVEMMQKWADCLDELRN